MKDIDPEYLAILEAEIERLEEENKSLKEKVAFRFNGVLMTDVDESPERVSTMDFDSHKFLVKGYHPRKVNMTFKIDSEDEMKDFIGCFLFLPSIKKIGSIKSLELKLFSSINLRDQSFFLLRLSLKFGNFPVIIF